MKNTFIREAHSTDMLRVLELIKELAVFEREPDAVEVTASQLQADGFGPQKAFQCFVAEVEGEVSGMALVYPRYSTWKGIVLHLEDLIVTESMRGRGLGVALLDRVVQYGAELGVKRISWEVLDWNTPAIDFYKNKGATLLREWDVIHLDEQGIQNYLQNI